MATERRVPGTFGWGSDDWDDDENGPDPDDEDADPLCDTCFGDGGWGCQRTGWTVCPDCFPIRDAEEAATDGP